MSGERKPLFRIAVRAEGEFVNAYMADPDSMADAVLLGSIRRRLADIPDVFAAWLDVMRLAMGVVLADLGFPEPGWKDPEPAPEHEKAGRA